MITDYVKKRTPITYSPAPWWNYDCQKAFKYKMKAFKTRHECRERYVRATSDSKSIQRMAFKSYNLKIKKKLSMMSTADSDFWSLIKDLTGLNNAKSSSAPSVEALAGHFADKMTNGKDVEDADFTPNNDHYIPLSNFRIRRRDVLRSLKKLDVSKSSDGFGNRFLKECAAVLEPVVTKIFRFVVRNSSFITKWKIQRVTPVHKRGSKTDASKYRPVSVVDNLCAVFEDTVKPQFSSWAMNFVPDWQFGFVPGSGTNDYDCLERRKQGVLIATDIKGAFDRCWWARLKQRLKKKGMRERAMKLIRSYFYKRFLKVVSQGKTSSLKEIFSSVPQGGKWSESRV